MPSPGPGPSPPAPSTSIEQDVLKKIQDTLLNRNKIYQDMTQQITSKLSAIGVNVLGGVVDVGKAIMDEGLRQAKSYEKNIVGVFGDISTQQETYGKSLGKLSFERTQEFRQEFMQMEAGGVRMLDAFKDAEDAAEHAQAIMSELPGSAAQFTDELQGQNLTIIQLLSKASGLASDETAAIMKVAKARKEDSKQMLSDIGTFSKTLADKFGLDTKRVAKSVVEITQNTSTFGKVSIEAAAAAAAKFESLGVTIEDVAGSIGSTFGSFSGAADAAAKLSQVFGVNVDAMQMMVDVNSGPEGMLSAMDNLRESLIGAGVDASELSAPMRRLIKDMTGVRDDATIDSLFDPDRMSADTEDILESAKKAAEAQKEPADALKFLDNDISKVRRSVTELNDLVSRQQLARLGTQSVEAAKGFSQLSSSSARFFDSANLFLERSEKLGLGKVLTDVTKTAKVAADVGRSGVEGADKMIKATAAAEGVSLTAATPVNYAQMQTAGRGAGEDQAYQQITGYRPPQAAIENAEAARALENARDIGLKAMKEKQDSGAVTQQTSTEFDGALRKMFDAYKKVGVDLESTFGQAGQQGVVSGTPTSTSGVSAVLAGGTLAGSQPPGATSVGGVGPTLSSVTPPPNLPAGAIPTATQPVMVSPLSPVAPTPNIPAAASPAQLAPGAPTATPGAPSAAGVSASGPVNVRGGATTVQAGTATASIAPGAPTTLNVNVTIESGALARALATYTNIATV